MYGFFKRMKGEFPSVVCAHDPVKDAIENAIKSTAPRSKRSMHLSSAEKAGGASPSMANGSPHASKTSLVSTAKASPNAKKSSLPPAHDAKVSSESGRFANLGRKVSSATKRDHGGQGHERAPSVLSVNTRSMIGAFNESFDSDDSREKSQDQDDFDALVRSGETMKVSLTPSRLKTFEVGQCSYTLSPPARFAHVYVLFPGTLQGQSLLCPTHTSHLGLFQLVPRPAHAQIRVHACHAKTVHSYSSSPSPLSSLVRCSETRGKRSSNDR